MRKAAKISLVAVTVWLVTLYGYDLAIIATPQEGEQQQDSEPAGVLAASEHRGFWWSPNPALVKSEGGWDNRIWRWHEFLGCGSMEVLDDDSNIYNYSRWSTDGVVEMSLLTPPELDWVHVSGISVGSAWDDLEPVYQPEPLDVSRVNSLLLEAEIAGWKGAPLSPVIFPSWHALLSDVWFNVTDVTIERENGRTEEFGSKILGMDVFYQTMTGGLNAVMGGGNEFSRVEPCNENFIYSINLAGQEFYSQTADGLFVIDLLTLLEKAQQRAAEEGWHFSIENVELVMFETVVESYWSYAQAEIKWNGIRYCTHNEQEQCAIE